MEHLRLLGVSGSIRRGSGNTAVLQALREALASRPGVELTLHPIDTLPLFNIDLEGRELPQAVLALQQAVRDADGLVICTPEYNYGTSGVLKNALDWASRPSMNSPLKGKPALVMSAANATTGGVRAIPQVRDTLVSCQARVVARPDVVVTNVQSKVIDGHFRDDAVVQFALRAIDDLLAEIRLLRRPALS
jgi:chromate reductase